MNYELKNELLYFGVFRGKPTPKTNAEPMLYQVDRNLQVSTVPGQQESTAGWLTCYIPGTQKLYIGYTWMFIYLFLGLSDAHELSLVKISDTPCYT